MAKLKFHGDLYENSNRVINQSNASNATPSAPGTASAGSSINYARADHTHAAQTTLNGHTLGANVPPVSASDNGKVLGVSGGSLATVNVHSIPSGGTTGQVLKKSSDTDYAVSWGDESGGQPIVVTIAYGSSGYYEADKMFDDIQAAISAGQTVILKYSDRTYTLYRNTASNIYFFYSDSAYNYYQASLYKYSSTVTRASLWSNSVYIPSTPDYATQGGIIWIHHEDENQYEKGGSGNRDEPSIIIEGSWWGGIETIFSYDGYYNVPYFNPVLIVGDNMVFEQNWEDEYGANSKNADVEVYPLVRKYTTYEPSEYSWDVVQWTGHLVFSKIIIDNGTAKLRTYTIDCPFGYSDIVWSDYGCVYAYTDITLGQAPSAQGVNF